jgi:putative transposase
MKLRRVYRFKLEPNTEQTQKLYQLAGARRFVCNWALARRNEFYKAEGKTIPAALLSRELTQLKQQEDRLWLQEADSQLLQQSLKDVDKAFQNFFAGRGRFPKFKSRNRGHFAFRIPQRVKVENGRVYCPKIGWVRIHQSQDVEGTTKSATFKRDACGDWFVTLTAEFEMPDTALPEPQNAVGVDLGLKDFCNPEQR